jgi:hypothetical protein
MSTDTLDMLTPYNEVRAVIEQMKTENAAKVFDITTKPGEKAARSHIAKLRTVKADIDRKRVALKADALALGKRIDAVAKDLTAEVEGMIEVHQKPLDEAARKEAEAAAAIAAEAARVEAEKQAAVQAELDKLRREAAERAEADRKAAEAAERAAREERIAKEAAAAERKKAEDAALAEARRKEAETQAAINAEREKTAKAQREAEQARREKAEAEAKLAREAKAKADADAKRAADVKHRERILAEIADDITLYKSPQQLLEALVAGKIRHVSVRF